MFYDFEYDGICLSEKGYMICKFGSNGVETVSNGSYITFNTTPTMNGVNYELTGSEYSDCLTATFQICKNSCNSNSVEMTIEELRDIMRWLNRREFHKFKLLNAEYTNIFFEASFNISKIEIDGKIYGLELEMFTNRPFAIQEPVVVMLENIVPNDKKIIYSISDEEGHIYPDMEITIHEDGDLEIYNVNEGRTMRIANCKSGEVININYPLIRSSVSSHKIQNDFNWKFFRITNTFRNKENSITTSLPCNIKITYSPIVKVGI
jgi:hypothetical protein